MENRVCNNTNTTVRTSFNGAATAPERVDFVRKVYGLLALSLLTGTGCAAAGLALHPGSGLAWKLLSLGVAIFVFAWRMRHNRIWHFCALLSFAGTAGLSVSVLARLLVEAESAALVVLAPGICCAVFAALAACVHLGKRDMGFVAGLFAAMAMVFTGGAAASAAFSAGSLALACAGALLFSGFAVFDTALLLHRHAPQDYIAATTVVYIDFVNLFVGGLAGIMR